jgi:hypothetical protein
VVTGYRSSKTHPIEILYTAYKLFLAIQMTLSLIWRLSNNIITNR